jgi:hypothetical protein
LRVRVHHPNLRIGHVRDARAGALEDTDEDRGLVFEEKSREGDGEDEAQILAAIAGEHAQGDKVHFRARTISRTPASEKAWM